MLGDNIKKLREERGLDQEDVAKAAGVSVAYISLIESNKRQNPSTKVLAKIANVLGVSVEELFKDINDINNDITDNKDNKDSISIKFKTPEEAMKFILEQNIIMGFGGFDINKLSDEEKIEFANELLRQLKLLSYKYKK